MSAVLAYEIRCDCADCANCRCGNSCTYAEFGTCGIAITDYGTATQVRRRLRANGWQINLTGGRDRCWDCAPNNA